MTPTDTAYHRDSPLFYWWRKEGPWKILFFILALLVFLTSIALFSFAPDPYWYFGFLGLLLCTACIVAAVKSDVFPRCGPCARLPEVIADPKDLQVNLNDDEEQQQEDNVL